ncbi:MAG: PP2C family protein-serine/threonine phosphatase [Balneolaceae bacterium]|nr:PP2C family protein-serine/threonine phosphatase [Balneolaceae bacterium]
MSLIKQNQSFSVRDYLFIAVGLLGLFGFLMTYGDHDPRSMLTLSAEHSEVASASDSLADFLGFNMSNFRSQILFRSEDRLLDSLQHNLGRREVITRLLRDSSTTLFPFVWEVHYERKSPGATETGVVIGNNADARNTEPNEFIIQLDPSGRWTQYSLGSDIMHSRSVNREAVLPVFRSETIRDRYRSLPDSLWHDRLGFDLQQDYNDTLASGSPPAGRAGTYLFSRRQITRMSNFYLEKTAWNIELFNVEDVRIESRGNGIVALLRYRSEQPIYGQQVTLETSITPTGSLLNLNATYNPNGGGGSETPQVWQLITIVLIFLFGIAVITIFYFRIRARVVDTRSALVISIIAGFIVPAIVLLNELHEIDFLLEGSSWVDFVGVALSMGITGAMASVGLFVISGVGDSLTRQHWQQKLECYDYLRLGMFFNKPVGEVLVRSVVLLFILAGLWSALLFMFPDLYIQVDEPVLSYEVLWPPVFLVFDNLWYSMIYIFSIYLVLGSQVYAQTSSKWVAGLVMVLAVAITEPVFFGSGPQLDRVLLMGFLGMALTAIYLYWDFLTLFVTHFLFNSFLMVAGGWLVGNSPDFYLVILYLLTLTALVVVGSLFIVRGKEQQALPDYVPEYVEELAQEERIKQELQIARDVQQSFLPVRTPEVPELDLAAICKPAYETGGDYYDFIPLDNHRLGVAIGDVSGKGIQAAFYMTFTKGVLHTLCRETESPAEVLKKANRLFYENAQRGTFISLIYGIVDTRRMTFSFARAGHNPILHYSAAQNSLSELQPNGLGLGLTISESFDNNIEERTLRLGREDLLVLYTDGVVESLNTNHKFYGTERLRTLIESRKNKNARDVLTDLVTDVTGFSGDAQQHDDMTIMVIKLKNGS